MHTGKRDIRPDIQAVIRHLSPELPAVDTCPRGAIVGVCFVERAVSLEVLRQEQGCGSDCDPAAYRHSATCRLSPYAHGPKCSFISTAIRLGEPVLCGGQVGCWNLKPKHRQRVEAQLAGMCDRVLRDRSWCRPQGHELPLAWPLPWLPRESDGTCRHTRFPPSLAPPLATELPARTAAVTSPLLLGATDSPPPRALCLDSIGVSVALDHASPAPCCAGGPQNDATERSAIALGVAGTPARGGAFSRGNDGASRSAGHIRSHLQGGEGGCKPRRDQGPRGMERRSGAPSAPPSGAAAADEEEAKDVEMSAKSRSGSRGHLRHR